MDTREELRRRPDVAEDDVDDIIGIVADLQEARRGRAEVADVERVATELDLDPKLVQEAIGLLQQRREAEAASLQAATQQAAATREARRTTLLRVLVGVLIATALLFGVGAVGASGIASARADVDAAADRLDVVVDRQASLAPQLVGLAGGDASTLAPLVQAVRDAPNPDARVDAATALAAAMSAQIGRLPPPEGEAAMQQRLDLQHELTGSQNRITVEARRLSEARRGLADAASRPTGRLAIDLGLASAP